MTTLTLWNKSFVFCLLNNFLICIFFFAQTAILPVYILNELNGNVSQAGLVMTLFLLSAIATRPFSGLIIEKMGVKKTLYLSQISYTLLCFSYIFADSITSLFVIRLLHGISFSLLTTVLIPVVNEFIPDQRKGEGIGYYGMSVNLGLVLGPMIGLLLIKSWSYAALAILLASIVLLACLVTFLIPFKSQKIPAAPIIKKSLSIHDFFETRVIPVSVLLAMVSFCYSSIMAFVSIYAESKHMLQYASLFFAVFAISMMMLRPFTGRLFDRKGPDYVLYPALLCFALGLIVLSQMNSFPVMMMAAILIGFGFGSVQPCLQALTLQSVPKHRVGHASSTFYTLYDIGIASGSFLLGVLITHYDYSTAYLGCSVLVLFSLLYYRFVIRRPVASL